MINYNELRDGQEFYANGYKKGYEDAKKSLEKPMGEWIKIEEGCSYHYVCNNCYEQPLKSRYTREDEFSNYCPNCGAEMKIGVEECSEHIL